MISGQQKAHFLLQLLGSQAQSVLKHLPQESASKLTATVGDVPDLRGEDRQQFFEDLFKSIERHRVSGIGLNAPINSDAPASKSGSSLFSLDDKSSSSSSFSNSEAESLDVKAETMAEHLSSQSPQMVAFFLSRVEEDLASAIRRNLPSGLLSSVEDVQVDQIPLSDKVFDRLYAQVSVKKEGSLDSTSSGSFF